jgi:hypothetical protein
VSIQVLGVDFLGRIDEHFKFVGSILLEPDLVHVVDLDADGVLAEEVAHENVFDVVLAATSSL